MLKIQSIDTVSQSFHARCFVQLRLKGAKDRREAFVTFGDGATESVEWFAGRIEPLNSFEHDSCTLIDEKPAVRDDGEDLVIQLRFEGRFYQPMRLHAFPFDSQQLSIEFLILCRIDGPVPSEVNVSPRVSCRLVDSGFAPRFQWRPKGEVRCHAGTHEANGRIFPKFGATARVARESRFYLTNVALPTAVFSGLAFTLFAAQPSEPMERLSVPLRLLAEMCAPILSSRCRSRTIGCLHAPPDDGGVQDHGCGHDPAGIRAAPGGREGGRRGVGNLCGVTRSQCHTSRRRCPTRPCLTNSCSATSSYSWRWRSSARSCRKQDGRWRNWPTASPWRFSARFGA